MSAKTVVSAEQSGNTILRVSVPDMPGCECDIWCYEDAFGAAKEIRNLPDGSLLMVHRHQQDEAIVAETYELSLERAVDFQVTVEAPSREQLQSVTSVNPCWQLYRAQAFRNLGHYAYDFVPRCFFYSVRGYTPLTETLRFYDTQRPPNYPTNMPTWVQAYPPLWSAHSGQPEKGWGNSTDRPVAGIVGIVSHDAQHLTAFGWRRTYAIGQGWHNCLHPGPDLTPDYDDRTKRIVSQGRLYFMRNDPDALLETYYRDFPPDPAAIAVGPRPDGGLAFSLDGDAGSLLHALIPDTIKVSPLSQTEGVRAQPHADGSASKWRRNICGAFTSHGKAAEGAWQAWAYPQGNKAHFFLSLRNDAHYSIKATAPIKLQLGDKWVREEASTVDGHVQLIKCHAGRWHAALLWEGGPAAQASDGAVTLTAEFRRIIPHDTQTSRGVLIVTDGSQANLQEAVEKALTDWQHATPYRVTLAASDA